MDGVERDGNEHADGISEYDERDIVEDRVPEENEGVVGREQVLEVVEAAPGAFEQSDRVVDVLK